MPNNAEWLQEKLGSPIKLHLNEMDGDVSAMLSCSAVDVDAGDQRGDAPSAVLPPPATKDITKRAHQNGLLVTGKAAEKFVDKVTMQQMTLDMLSTKGFSQFKESLRTTLPAQAPATHASELRLCDPATATDLEEELIQLPGPHSVMTSSVRQLAVHKRHAEVEDNGEVPPAKKVRRNNKQLQNMKALREDPEYRQREAERQRLRRLKKRKRPRCLLQRPTRSLRVLQVVKGGGRRWCCSSRLG